MLLAGVAVNGNENIYEGTQLQNNVCFYYLRLKYVFDSFRYIFQAFLKNFGAISEHSKRIISIKT